MAAQEPSRSSQGVQIVGTLLKVWPVKEAPLPVQIAFYEELQRTVEPYAGSEGREAKWFGQLAHELSNSLTKLRQLAEQQARESKWAKERLDAVVNKVPSDLRRVLREARS